MLNYNTGISATPPLSPQFRQGILTGLTSQPGMGVAEDNYAAYAQKNAVDADRAMQMANAEYEVKARDLQSQLAQRGLQQMAQAQQNQADLGTRQYQTALNRTQDMFRNVNGLLGGLFS